MTMMEGRLRKRVRAMGLPDLKQYCDYLFEQNGLASEAIELINVVTTNKTEFFREPDHFRFLAEQAVPQLLARTNGRAPLKVWSAACSIGAEPYTIAMVLATLARQSSGLRFVITATDICTEVLETAVAGIYPEEMIKPVPPDMRHLFIMRSKNRARQQVRMVPQLRATIQFARLNLMDTAYQVDKDMDVIFCRNMLIYFEKETQEAVLQRLTEHLKPGGYMIIGHSETITGFNLPLKPVAPTVFRCTREAR